jgi:hypothetical protein
MCEDFAHSGGVVLAEVFALELQDVSDQQFSILTGHPDKTAMEAVRVEGVGDGINPQHFEGRLKKHLAGKEQGARENFIHLEDLVECDADPAGTDVDGSLDERSLGFIRLMLEADGESDSDTIKLTAIFRRRLRSRGIRWHGGQEYIKMSGPIH